MMANLSKYIHYHKENEILIQDILVTSVFSGKKEMNIVCIEET